MMDRWVLDFLELFVSVVVAMQGKQLSTFVVAAVLLPFSFLTVLLRVVARVSIGGFSYDDALMVVAEVRRTWNA